MTFDSSSRRHGACSCRPDKGLQLGQATDLKHQKLLRLAPYSRHTFVPWMYIGSTLVESHRI
jgi:hypothetical protein